LTPFDAYEDEMRGLPRRNAPDINALLNGKAPPEAEVDDLAAFVRDVRDTYLVPPDDATAARHLAAMSEAARDSALAGEPGSNRTLRDRWALKWKGTVPRMRTATLAAKLAALTIVAALATGGLAAAGVISLPDLPGQASDEAEEAHEAVDGQDPSSERSNDASQQREDASARQNGDVGVQQNDGADPDPETLREFGDSVSDRATGEVEGGPRDIGGEEFGRQLSEEAQQLVPRPTPQNETDAQNDAGPQTGETFSQQGQETGESFSQGGRQTGDEASGGRVP
jgi:hypothetical protein